MKPLSLSAGTVRRLAIARQHLSDPAAPVTADRIMQVIRDLSCLQLDPTSAVSRSHLLVLWSRLGNYAPSLLDRLLWEERRLFEYWAHAASIVLTEDYPIHQFRMDSYLTGDSPWDLRLRDWTRQNAALRRYVLTQLRKRGPLPLRALEDRSQVVWKSSGWSSGQNVQRMLNILWAGGRIMVARRVGSGRLWDLAERCLPAWTPRERLAAPEAVSCAAQRSLRALGVATAKQIANHFTRGRYPGLASVLDTLVNQGEIIPAQVRRDGESWPGQWYVHHADLPLVERLAHGDWQPRTTLLSPFDNLIIDRVRTELLFNFRFRLEIYTPKAKREHGYFVLPILHGDKLIGRVDPRMDRKRSRLMIHAVHAEPGAPSTRATARAVKGAIEELATFLGARAVAMETNVPQGWASVLR